MQRIKEQKKNKIKSKQNDDIHTSNSKNRKYGVPEKEELRSYLSKRLEFFLK